MASSRRAFLKSLGTTGSLTAAMVAWRGHEALAGQALQASPAVTIPAGAIRLDSNENPNGP